MLRFSGFEDQPVQRHGRATSACSVLTRRRYAPAASILRSAASSRCHDHAHRGHGLDVQRHRRARADGCIHRPPDHAIRGWNCRCRLGPRQGQLHDGRQHRRQQRPDPNALRRIAPIRGPVFAEKFELGPYHPETAQGEPGLRGGLVIYRPKAGCGSEAASSCLREDRLALPCSLGCVKCSVGIRLHSAWIGLRAGLDELDTN